MKMTMMISLIFGFLILSASSFAQGELNKVIQKKEQNQSSEKKQRRRKKVQMCNECGKPEPECECEGHGEEGHLHDNEEGKD